MVSPAWLAPIAPEAHVQPLSMKMLESYLCPCPDGRSLGLGDAVNDMTGVLTDAGMMLEDTKAPCVSCLKKNLGARSCLRLQLR